MLRPGAALTMPWSDSGGGNASLREEIAARKGEACDGLAAINLEEAERSLADGDAVKARDHLELAHEFAVAPEIVGRVELLARRLAAPTSATLSPDAPAQDLSCSSCAGSSCTPSRSGAPAAAPPAATDEHLSPEERFELMTAALPEDLPRRYRALGGRFVQAYLLSHDGDDEAAATILASITIPASQDIVLYELALIRHRQGDAHGCEELLRQALRLNERNPLCCLALVDLFVGSERPEEAVALLDAMIALELLPAQALMIKGDIFEQLGLEEQALDSYAHLLETPLRKDAATRIVPILEKRGRGEEARQVYTRYIKGCC